MKTKKIELTEKQVDTILNCLEESLEVELHEGGPEEVERIEELIVKLETISNSFCDSPAAQGSQAAIEENKKESNNEHYINWLLGKNDLFNK